MAIDPVCKMEVEPGKIKADHAGQVYYFCSEAYRTRFVAEPLKYLNVGPDCCQGDSHRHR